MMTPHSAKSYLIRALYDWCVDSGFTPHIVVVVDQNTRVPAAYVREGQIVLNIAPYATHQLSINNDDISCEARFGGQAQSLYVPIANVIAIYARENGQGMAFEPGTAARVDTDPAPTGQLLGQDVAPAPDVPDAPAPGDNDRPPPGRSHLRIVK